MGQNGTGNPVLGVVLALIVASILLAIIGFLLRGRGKLRTRNAALGWAILCVLPLFGAGLAWNIKHDVENATGETRSGVNEPGVKGAP